MTSKLFSRSLQTLRNYKVLLRFTKHGGGGLPWTFHPRVHIILWEFHTVSGVGIWVRVVLLTTVGRGVTTRIVEANEGEDDNNFVASSRLSFILSTNCWIFFIGNLSFIACLNCSPSDFSVFSFNILSCFLMVLQ